MGNNLANLELFFEIEIRDQNGKITKRCNRRSRSLLRSFALALRYAFVLSGSNQTNTVTTKNTAGSDASLFSGYSNQAWTFMVACAPIATDTWGIQIGRGTTPVTKTDYALETKCAHGLLTNQFQYGNSSIEDVEGVDPISKFRIIRIFTNGSGSSISINEIGLVISNTGGLFLIARDVFTSPIAVPTGSTLTIRYVFSVTA